MFVFNHFTMWLAILFINIIPGLFFTFALANYFKEKSLSFLEKVVLGLAVGFSLVPLLDFLLGFFIKFSLINSFFLSAIISLGSLVYLIKSKSFNFEFNFKVNLDLMSCLEGFGLVLLLILSFMVRFQSFSPVYQELDPYFYAYGAYQLTSLGYVPLRDTTAWYPLVNASHRTVPLIEHVEAEWLSFYEVINKLTYTPYLLSAVSNYYPPIAASLMFFFVYLLFSRFTSNKLFGLLIGFVFAYTPVFISKMMSGVFEAQPYGFFAITAVLATLYLAVKNNSKFFLLMATLFFVYSILGSVSYIIILYLLIALSIVLFFLIVFNVKKEEKVINFLKIVAIISLGGFLAKSLFSLWTHDSLYYIVYELKYLIPILLYYFVEFSREHGLNELISKNKLVIVGFTGVALLLVFLSPLGSSLTHLAFQGLSVGQYNTPLERTIQEQQLTGKSFSSYLGKWGGNFGVPILDQITALISYVIDLLHRSIIIIINKITGTEIIPLEKVPNIAFLIVFIFIIYSVEYVYKVIKKGVEHVLSDPLILIIGLIFYPIFLVGLAKAKYIIFFSYVFMLVMSYVVSRIWLKLDVLKNWFKSNDAVLIGKVILVSFLLFYGNVINLYSYYMTSFAFKPKFSDNPKAFEGLMKEICDITHDDVICEHSTSVVSDQYSSKLCYISRLGEDVLKGTKISLDKQMATAMACNFMAKPWIDSMEWIRDWSLEEARITSWWDYGHWINFFGLRNAVIRNEHSSLEMILNVAHAFVMGNETELKSLMRNYYSKYVLIDREIVFGGNVFGGKFYALNYLACARDNLTNKEIPQMHSQCEFDNLWETVVVGNEPCFVSNVTGKKGVIVYKQRVNVVNNNPSYSLEPYYCLSTTKLVDGKEIPALYYLNKKTSVGDLVLNKGFLYPVDSNEGIYVVLYTKDKVWVENGEVKSGWEDRKGRFYDSVLYKGYVLGELEGFRKVYDDGYVKIFEKIS